MFKYLNIVIAEIRRSLKESFSYKMGLVSDIVVLTLLYAGLIFMDTGSMLGEYYNNPGNSKTLLLLGYIFWSYSIAAISGVSSEISIEAVKGTLEQKFMAVIPYPFLIAGNIISSLLLSSIVAAVIIAFSNLIIGVSITVNGKVILSLLMTLVGMYGMGLILGGLSLIAKRINQLTLLIQILLLFVTDTLSKTSPSSAISCIIPLTVGNDIARKSVSNIVISYNEWLMLILVSMLWFVVGSAIFGMSSRYARKNGLLGTY
ncbi:hypothetical protein JCM16816_04740 [Thermoanaerobacter brockii subsp. lactiethylicus]|jgi:ABC-2 type transport system permease protein|uniref:ABC transporter permease n=1 Tax=unclassified Thermoanaerobacter TaxID=2636821 RepID=UPI0000E1D910|nr:ABC transporter permease [Thermoanaerobacter sp. X514]ABY91646.1 ABC-2 type transporter [Thermoanaerobacter sp. X514]KUJ90201.1 MAG: hypothetical protein XD37_1595 [Thermoanaerobacter thermocopriae]MDI3501864.1 type transport system permease protein [Thermoanaerobacter sp.]